MKLSNTESKALKYMAQYYKESGNWPSLPEISKACGCKDPTGAHYAIRGLNIKRILIREGYRAFSKGDNYRKALKLV